MSSRPLRSFSALAMSAAILLSAPLALACGPFTLSAVFTFTVHPEYPLEHFARGDIGVVQPSYARSYLVVAYRHLAGISLNEEEQKAVVELWRDRLDLRWSEEDARQIWLQARAKVLGVGEPPQIESYRRRKEPNEYDSFLNCQNDAFKNAAVTLEDRMSKLSPDNSLIKDWVSAQDLVFANCGEGSHIPAAAPAGADPLIKRDRDYQIAAANFYATNFAEARSGFAAIARDRNSPWQQTAFYLIARTFVREASLGAPDKKQETLAAAEKQLNAILSDARLQKSHHDARRLMSLVRLRLHPDERTRELGQLLLTKNQNAAIKQYLWDYTALLDQFVLVPDVDEERDVPAELRRDDLTDWIGTFQSKKPDATEHAVMKWQSTASLPWLIAALAKVSATHSQTTQLLTAASNLSADSPAFATVAFHTARLALEAGRADAARANLDELLTKHREQFNASGLNLMLGQRMMVAKDVDEFLKYAQRVPAALSWDDDGREIPADEAETSAETKSVKGKELFDVDAARLLNKKFPLAVWGRAAESKMLPAHLRNDLAQAAFLRAVLLGDFKTADALVPTMKTLMPALAGYLDKYLAVTQPDAKRFAAIYMWLKFPGMEPVVDAGLGRQTLALNEQDSYRDNWWCSAAFPDTPNTNATSTTTAPAKVEMIPTFLSDVQRLAGEKDFAMLSSLGAAPNYLSREVIQWATKSGADPRVPEALHLAVKSTRYGCTDKQTARWSKAAFDLLHRRYPRSSWAKQTPYWFKD